MILHALVLLAPLTAGPAPAVDSIADDDLAGYARIEAFAARLYGIATDPARLIGDHSIEGIEAWVET